jgi:hypothetical protein
LAEPKSGRITPTFADSVLLPVSRLRQIEELFARERTFPMSPKSQMGYSAGRLALRGGEAPSGYAVDRATVRQKKTGQPVRFELTEQTRQAVDDYLRAATK